MEKIASRGVASSGGHMVWKCPSSFFLPSSLQVSHPPRCLRRRQRFFVCASEREWGLLEGGGQRMGAVAVLAVIVACDIVDKPKIILPRFIEFFLLKNLSANGTKKYYIGWCLIGLFQRSTFNPISKMVSSSPPPTILLSLPPPALRDCRRSDRFSRERAVSRRRGEKRDESRRAELAAAAVLTIIQKGFLSVFCCLPSVNFSMYFLHAT